MIIVKQKFGSTTLNIFEGDQLIHAFIHSFIHSFMRWYCMCSICQEACRAPGNRAAPKADMVFMLRGHTRVK